MKKAATEMKIYNTAVLNENYEVEFHKTITIVDGCIQSVTDYEATDIAGGGERLDGKKLLFLPGLIDSHIHTGQQLLRGQVLDAMPMIWTRIMLPFESTLTPERMKLSAQLAALEMIKSGTTGFVEAGGYFMEEAALVYMESGLRGALSYSTMDQKGLPETISDTAETAIAKTDSLYDLVQGNDRMKVYYSLRSLLSCSQDLIEQAASRAEERNTFLQAHMNEYAGEVNFILEREKMRPYEYLEKLGVLNSRFLGSHSLLLSETEMEIVQAHGVKSCHCPFSNCGKAVPNTPALLKKGISVGLGSDGTAHGGMSLWNEMKIFRSVMNIFHGVPKAEPAIMPAASILKMVLEGGAAALNETGHCGKLKAGYRADLVGIDLNQPHLLPSGNYVNTLVESVNAGDVTHMIVGGQMVMKNREILTLDEERILYDARKFMEERKTR